MLLILNNIQKEDRGDIFLIKQDHIHAAVKLNSLYLLSESFKCSLCDLCIPGILYSEVLIMALEAMACCAVYPYKINRDVEVMSSPRPSIVGWQDCIYNQVFLKPPSDALSSAMQIKDLNILDMER